MKPAIIIAIAFVLLIQSTVFAQLGSVESIRHEKDIPDWFQYVAWWFMEDEITTHEFMTAIAWLVNENIIKTEYASQMKQSSDVVYSDVGFGSFENAYTKGYAYGEATGRTMIDGINYAISHGYVFPETGHNIP
jgi:hypothetical protein